MSSPAIEIRGLTKAFGANRVLDEVDLEVQPGTIQGYIGPNGAGKSTTVKILAGLLTGYSGEVRVAGFDPKTDVIEIKRRIGYVPENAVLFEALTVSEFLLFVGRLHGLEDEQTRQRADEFLKVFEIHSRLRTRISTLSKGMRQKLLLTSALLHDPQILFMDEPLSGLDVSSSILIKEFLRRLADSGRTIFYCSHVMDVVERVCDRIAILRDGKVLVEGTFEELSEKRGGGTLESIFAGLTSEGGQAELAERLVTALGADGKDQTSA